LVDGNDAAGLPAVRDHHQRRRRSVSIAALSIIDKSRATG